MTMRTWPEALQLFTRVAATTEAATTASEEVACTDKQTQDSANMLCLVIVGARMNEWPTNAAPGGLRCAYQKAAAKDGAQRRLSRRLTIEARS